MSLCGVSDTVTHIIAMTNTTNYNGYQNAPATTLLAVYCACCGTILGDAKSIEIGMGPHCRAKHGFRKADLEPDWISVIASVKAALDADPELTMDLDVEDARVTANRITHRIATLQVGPAVPYLVLALARLGFTKLSDRIGKRVGQVTVVTREDGSREFYSPFVDGIAYELRRIGGDFVRGKEKFWLLPAGDITGVRLMAVIAQFFPVGTIVRGPTATVVIPAREAA